MTESLGSKSSANCCFPTPQMQRGQALCDQAEMVSMLRHFHEPGSCALCMKAAQVWFAVVHLDEDAIGGAYTSPNHDSSWGC